MKYTFIFFLLFCTNVNAQSKVNWAQVNMYTFYLPDGMSIKNIKATIQYKGKPLVSKKRYIGKQTLQIRPTFVLVDSCQQINIYNKLPIKLPSKMFVWLLNNDMVIEMATYPNRFKINIQTNPTTNTEWALPTLFNMVSDNVLNIAYLQNLSKAAQQQVLLQKTYTLSIPTK